MCIRDRVKQFSKKVIKFDFYSFDAVDRLDTFKHGESNSSSMSTCLLYTSDATNALVMGKDGTVYYARDADEQVKIASITKVMTAILTVENCKIDVYKRQP